MKIKKNTSTLLRGLFQVLVVGALMLSIFVTSPAKAATGVDLIITGYTITPPDPDIGEAFTISVTVLNQGTSSTQSTVYRHVFVDTGDPNLLPLDEGNQECPSTDDPYENYFREDLNQELDPNIPDTRNIEVPTGLATGGVHELWLYVDAKCINIEDDETNNAYGPIFLDIGSEINVSIGGVNQGDYFLNALTGERVSFPAINQGPAKVTNLTTGNTIASIRVLFGGVSYSEMMGYPADQLTNEYVFPWYNNMAMDSQLRVSNLGGVSTTINVYVGSSLTPIDTYALAAGAATRKNYAGVNNGPLRVTSSATNIISTIRVLYGGLSYSELVGFPANQLTNEYIFPYYNNVAMDSQLRVSNLGAGDTTINVYVGSSPTPIDTYTLAAGAATRINYPGVNNGPLRVTSSTANILTTIRVIFSPLSYSELLGFPVNQLTTAYTYPVYNNVSVDSQLRVSNVGNATTTITVFSGSTQIDSYDLAAGAATRINYSGVNNGPLRVESSGQPILTTTRMLYYTTSFSSYYEMTGMPDNLLHSEYVFPWYNNTAMDSQVRFALP